MTKKINKDKKFGDFILRTRLKWKDENIIKENFNDPYKIPRNGKIAIDIGGNIGISSLMCAKFGYEKIYAYEPCFDNFNTLVYNVVVNNFEDKIKYFNYGVGSPGLTKLYLHNKNSGAISSKKYNTGLDDNNFEMVNFISIKDVFEMNKIEKCDLLKMDCEGGEEEIIRDIDDELAGKISQISLEFHNKKTINELVEKLSKWYVPENVHRYIWVFRRKEEINVVDDVVNFAFFTNPILNNTCV